MISLQLVSEKIYKRVNIRAALTALLVVWIIVLLLRQASSHLQSSLSQTRSDEALIAASRRLPRWKELIDGRAPSLGNNASRVAVIEFSDYQCPFCRLEESRLQTLVARHPQEVVLYRYDLPHMEIHPYSRAAALAARCGNEQGITEVYQEKLFASQGNFASLDFAQMASEVGLSNKVQFMHCLERKDVSRAVDRDVQTSRELTISATPTLIINGRLITGAVPQATLERLYEDSGDKR